jgi:uncharacterized protein (DUF1800 family)
MAKINRDEAAHLLRRMSFGGSPREIDELATRRREGAVDSLLNYEAADNQVLDDLLQKRFNPKKFTPRDDLQLWWIIRMILSARPFEEKMTLFWHNHFATALDKVEYDLMYVQNQILRANALSRFDTLLLNVAKDPAMLVWLDGVTNVLGSPNENFSRELQELFTMGVTDVVTGERNYTEQDVKEIARAFTGWKFRQKGEKRFVYIPFLEENQHDNGAKTIYGRRANFTAEDVIATVCERRATGRFLITKLFEFFVYPLSDSDEDRATTERFADVYIQSDHSMKQLMRAIFISDEFFSERARFALIKSPAELVAGAIRMLSAQYNPGSVKEGDFELYNQFKRMGLDLLNPFDVSGWKLNLGWLNTATLIERYNFANNLISNRDDRPGAIGAVVTDQWLRKNTGSTSRETIDRFLEILGPLKLDAQAIGWLVDYLETDDHGARRPFTPSDQTIDKKVRGLVFLIMCLPEFQMN